MWICLKIKQGEEKEKRESFWRIVWESVRVVYFVERRKGEAKNVVGLYGGFIASGVTHRARINRIKTWPTKRKLKSCKIKKIYIYYKKKLSLMSAGEMTVKCQLSKILKILN
jgi:hypothetical protein